MVKIALVLVVFAACADDHRAVDACAAHDYSACTTDDGKDGWCVPRTGCVEACSEVSHACWNYTYVWPNDPEMQHEPICWCSDDS